MKNLFKIISIVVFTTSSYAQSFSEEVGEDVMDYESIVRELSPTNRTTYKSYGDDPLAQVRFHMGVGFANSIMSLTDLPEGASETENLKGIQAKFGIDLLSPFWRAEGGITTYETAQDRAGNKYELKEFDLSLISISPVSRVWGYKFGGGLSARYLDFTQATGELQSFSTPAANIQLGILAYFSKKMTLSTDVSYRRALTTDSIDQSALDLSIRFDGHF